MTRIIDATKTLKFEIAKTGDVEIVMKLSSGSTVSMDQMARMKGARRIIFLEEDPDHILVEWKDGRTTRSGNVPKLAEMVPIIAAKLRAKTQTREQIYEELILDIPKDKILVAAMQLMRDELVKKGELGEDHIWSAGPEINEKVATWIANLDGRGLVKLRLLAEDVQFEPATKAEVEEIKKLERQQKAH